MRRWLMLAIAVLAAVMVLGGCGGSSSSSALSPPTSSTTGATAAVISAGQASELVATGTLADWKALSLESKGLIIDRYAAVVGDTTKDENVATIVIAGIDGAATADGAETTTIRAALNDLYTLTDDAVSGGSSFDTVACEDALGDLISSLEEIDGRLDVGLPYAAYSERVGDASVAYNRIDFKSLDIACVQKVGVFVEQGLNRYIRAEDRWGDCINDYACDTDSIEPALQRHWAQASKLIERARGALA